MKKLLVLATFLMLLGSYRTAWPADRPNILFIFSDDHACQAIGAYGSKINKTPNIDRIAKEGAVFRHSFCANSICGPSRACILTGKHSHKNGFLRNGNRFDSSQMTFPKLLQQVGYQTAIIGKWHLSSDPVGFDYWEILPGQGSYYNPDFIQMDGSRKRFEGYCTDLITDKAIDWLQEGRDADKPFMLMCQHKAPHRNWAPPPRYLTLFQDQEIPEPATLRDDYSGRSKLLKENEMSLARHFSWGHDMKLKEPNLFPDRFPSLGNGEYRRMTAEQKAAWDAAYEPENQAFIEAMKAGKLTDDDILKFKYQRYIKDYLRCVQAVDDSVGRLLNWLEDNGLADNTIVIYSSDQGFYLGEHGWYDKRWMFEESLKMPFLIRWPGVLTGGIESDALIQNIDYAPTFLEIAGAEIPEEIQGRSLVPVLKNNGQAPADWRDAIYYAYYENAAVHNVPVHDGVRTDRYKLMYFPRTREWNLFDLERDPQELNSVHDEPSYAEILAGLQKRYRDLRKFYEVNTATIPATRGDEPGWRQRNQLLIERAQQAADAQIAFIGDSITQGWEGAGKKVWEEFYAPRQAINLGIGGDRTEHVIWRLTHGNLGRIQPKVAVLMIGTNNTGHLLQDPQEVAQGVRKILDILREKLPDTHIVLHAVFPRGPHEMDLMRLNNVAINQIIRRYADDEFIHYVDINDHFLEPDGTISRSVMHDLLHLTEAGYRRWANALEPTLKELGL
ncbi:MAG: acetylglucosamine-6-sulfatase [Pirellulaceae bacterium]|nr:MAG: acetylglucosamine-6-sulfatase [Pirellulaceae bacterium]